MLMVGTILGPGTIFLMMIGAINAITQISNFNALMLNLVPILFFIIICMTCKSETQVPFLLIIFFIIFLSMQRSPQWALVQKNEC